MSNNNNSNGNFFLLNLQRFSIRSLLAIFNVNDTDTTCLILAFWVYIFCGVFAFLIGNYRRFYSISINSTCSSNSLKDIKGNVSASQRKLIEDAKYKFKFRKILSASCGPVVTKCTEQLLDPTLLNQERLEALAKEEILLGQENAKEYEAGGYKAVVIGEILGDRYEVMRKLGFGHYSTVWLCQDSKENAAKKYVAIKIVKSAPAFTTVAKDEVRLLNCIMNQNLKHVGRRRIVEMLNYFLSGSVSGNHVCITFELMGPSLLHLLAQSGYCGLEIQGVKNIIRQVLEGLSYLHEVCKIIHTDIKPENILICVKEPYVKKLVEFSRTFKRLGVEPPKSYVSSLQFSSKVPENSEGNGRFGGYNVRSFSCVEAVLPKLEKPIEYKRYNREPMFVSNRLEVKIADLGNACWNGHPFTMNIQTKQYRALEVILGAKYSYPVDIWSVGCLAFELATGEYLFNPKSTRNFNSQEDHVLMIYELLEGIPEYVALRGDKSPLFFDETGKLRIMSPKCLKIWNTEDVLVDKYRWRRRDAVIFANLINSLIEPDPELRASASGALQHIWFRDFS